MGKVAPIVMIALLALLALAPTGATAAERNTSVAGLERYYGHVVADVEFDIPYYMDAKGIKRVSKIKKGKKFTRWRVRRTLRNMFLIDKIEKVSGAKSTSLSQAGIEALKMLGASKIVVANPHLQSIVDAEERYFKAAGFYVLKTRALDIEDSLEIGKRSPWENYRFVMSVYEDAPEADAIFISCGTFRSIEIIETLEKATGKPVVSSTTANAWMCLKLAGIKDPIFGCGRLLSVER